MSWDERDGEREGDEAYLREHPEERTRIQAEHAEADQRFIDSISVLNEQEEATARQILDEVKKIAADIKEIKATVDRMITRLNPLDL